MGGQEKSVPIKRGRGRPRTGEGQQIQVRMLPDLLGALDRWIEGQPEPKPTRPEAVRTLLKEKLGL